MSRKLKDYALGQAVDYLNAKARPLERAMFAYEFGRGSADAVVEELAQYQNTDGGFGYGLEPDLRTAASSAYATTVALQYCSHLPAEAVRQLTEGAMEYFRSTYKADGQGWEMIPKEAEEAPRAPWWGYATVQQRPHWGNPNAEIAGYYLQYGSEADRGFAESLVQTAIDKLAASKEVEFHELLCYLRLSERLTPEQQKDIRPHLAAALQQNVVTDPAGWNGYGLQPIKAVKSPDSPYAGMFAQAVEQNLDFILEKQTPGGCWEPEWSWGMYEEEWAQAKTEWSGVLTLEILRVLRAFGRIERYS